MFLYLFQEVFTDDSLLLHEEEVARCAAKLEIMTPLIKIVERRDQIRGKHTKYDAHIPGFPFRSSHRDQEEA